jgi:hypothetical protein
MHEPVPRGQKAITPDQLDRYVQRETNGAIGSFRELSAHRVTSLGILAQQRAAAPPNALTTGAEEFANAAGLGLPRKLDQPSANTSPLMNGMQPFLRGGSPVPQNSTGVSDLLNAGEAAHPMTAALSSGAGSMVPATLAGEVFPALKFLKGVPGHYLPGLMRSKAANALQGAAAAMTGAYAQSPELPPNPREMAWSALLGGVAGGAPPATGVYRATTLEPAQNLLGEAIQESSTGVTPSEHAGEAAIRSGTTTPMRIGPPRKGITSTPLSDAAIMRLPEPLRPLAFERSPAVRALVAKSLTDSPQVAAQAEQLLRGHIKTISDAAKVLEDHDESGYNAILNNAQVTDPEAVKLYQTRENTQKVPTGRDLFDLYRELRDGVRQDQIAKTFGTRKVNLKEMIESRGQVTTLKSALSQIPGFDALQARVAPYLQREEELQGQLQGIIGRSIKPIGKAVKPATGSYEEGLARSFGYEPRQINERTARQLLPVLFSSDPDAPFNFIKAAPERAQWLPQWLRSEGSRRGAKAAAGISPTAAAGSYAPGVQDALPAPVKKRLGLLPVP